jgi:hypothetical protein
MTEEKQQRGKGFHLPKGARVKLIQIGRKSGIHWLGRTPDGIPKWEGAWRGIPKWFKTIFKCLGIGLLGMSAAFAYFGMWQAVLGPAIAGCCHTFLGYFFWEWLDRKFNASMSVEEAAEQFGMEIDEFKLVVEERGIRPTHYFNDEPVYNLEAFGAVGTLLRAAERPGAADQVLLRPAGAGATNKRTDQLLRPVEGNEARTIVAVDSAEEDNGNEQEHVAANHLA